MRLCVDCERGCVDNEVKHGNTGCLIMHTPLCVCEGGGAGHVLHKLCVAQNIKACTTFWLNRYPVAVYFYHSPPRLPPSSVMPLRRAFMLKTHHATLLPHLDYSR